jgi:hypothetical protein
MEGYDDLYPDCVPGLIKKYPRAFSAATALALSAASFGLAYNSKDMWPLNNLEFVAGGCFAAMFLKTFEKPSPCYGNHSCIPKD